MSDIDNMIEVELDTITSKIKEGLEKASKSHQYSKIIRKIILANGILAKHFCSLTESKLAEIFKNKSWVNEELIKKTAHNTRDWFKKNEDNVNRVIEELNTTNLVEDAKSLKEVEVAEDAKQDTEVVKGTEQLDSKLVKDIDSLNKNKEVSKNKITESVEYKQQVILLNNKADDITKLTMELRETTLELKKKDEEVKILKFQVDELQKLLEIKNDNTNIDNYKVLLNISSVYKLKNKLAQNPINIELDEFLLDAVAEFVKKHELLDITNFTDIKTSAPSKMVEAALLAILQKNNFLKL